MLRNFLALKAVHDQLGFRGDYEMSVGGGEKL
jgi:hypothetical protein